MKTLNALSDSFKSVFVAVVIPLEILLATLIYIYILGHPDNFQGGDPANHPLPGNYLGIVYKGGYIVPLLMSLLMLVMTFSVERLLTISRARGKESITPFIQRIRQLISANSVPDAIVECDKQQGSVANVVKAGLKKYVELSDNQLLDTEKKVRLIQQDIEETTQLEMPMLEKNLVIIATIASIATLMGLLGTVMGMIKAFAALATAGAPDAVALANGISEALINTALGIGTSALAIIMYNFFTSRIDGLTYGIDEASYSIVQHFTTRDQLKA